MEKGDKVIIGQVENCGCPIAAEAKDSDYFLFHSSPGDLRWRFDGKNFILQQFKHGNFWVDIHCFIGLENVNSFVDKNIQRV